MANISLRIQNISLEPGFWTTVIWSSTNVIKEYKSNIPVL